MPEIMMQYIISSPPTGLVPGSKELEKRRQGVFWICIRGGRYKIERGEKRVTFDGSEI